jgi:DMSO/TMAO reductase YedYZ molybdopterin-dependent catalytic subunit
MTKPGALIGALVGALLAPPLIGVFYLGWKLAGLPFVPFDLFDWVARRLPGSVLTFGIETLVKVIRVLNLGSTAPVAKTVEQVMAIVGLLLTGVLGGAILFAIPRARRLDPNHPAGRLPGIALGIVIGVPAMLISASTGATATAGPLVSGLWILALFLGWGAAFGAVHARLSTRESAPAPGEPERATAGELEPAAVEPEAAAVERLDRRRFLVRVGGAAALITVSGAVVGALVGTGRRREVITGPRWSAAHPLPNAGVAVPAAPGTRPEFTPLEQHYRIDISLLPQTVSEEDWRLRIGGLVDKPLELTLANLRDDFTPLHQFVTLACISNEIGGDLISTTRWTGVSLRRLLPHLGLRPEATHLKITSADGFFEVVDLQVIKGDERVMLAYAWDDVPLLQQHGFPLRIYIPDRYGMKQPKWIMAIEALDHWEAGYWVERGWDREARMKATSVIDTVAVNAATTAGAAGQRLVPIGGIAHAGARGISKVEVQVDDGPWREASLRTPLSSTTWVIWRYDWPFQEGAHTFTVRCYDGGGAPQVAEVSEPHPSGATGLHRRRARL